MTIINLPTTDQAPVVPGRRLSVAPMMDWTE
jgi:tRNA-dihydrouridine synthase A